MAQKLAEGKLDVQVVAGRDLPRRSLFGRRDSAVELSLGTVRKRTQADRNGGAAPQWNDRVSFTVSGLGKTQLAVRALEIESSISDKTIGSCVIDLTRIFVEEEVDSWYALKFNDKPAGSVYLEFTFTPKGGRKNIKKDPLLEEEEYSAFKPEPKLPKSSDTVASAPSLLQQGSGPHTGDARPSPHLSAVSTLAPVPMRPSTSDMRPYSSASMHNPDLAIKYANKHGTKPLPSAPAVGFVAPGSIPDASMAMQQQPLPMAGYDQTMMPGQAPFAAQQYQQRMSYHPDMGTMYQQQPGMTMGPAQVQPQRIQPQEHQSLANMFAPLPQDDVSAMARPQSTMAAVAPGYNPAYVAVTDPQQQQQQQIVMQQQVPMGKQLPLPPGQPVSGAPVMVMMAVDPNAPHMTQQVQLMSPPYSGEYQMDPAMAMTSNAYAYGQMVAVSVPDMMQQQPQYMSPQEVYESPMMAQQVFVQQPQYVQQPMNSQQQIQPVQQMMVYAPANYQQGQQTMVVDPQGYITQNIEPSAPMMSFDNSQVQYVYTQPPTQHQQQYVYAPANNFTNQQY